MRNSRKLEFFARPCRAVTRIDGPLAAGQGFTHPANCVIAFSVVLPDAGTGRVTIQFRDTAANGNLWSVAVLGSGDIQLTRFVDGLGTAVGTAAAAAADNDRIAIVASGTTITVYVNGAPVITYGQASHFATATAAGHPADSTGGSAYDLKAWQLACRKKEYVP